MSLPNYFQILGLGQNASNEEIKSAYRRLAKIYHPDKHQNNPELTEKFKQIKEAYETLSDPIKKQKYLNRTAFYSYTSSSTTKKTSTSKTKSYTTTEQDIKNRKEYKDYFERQREYRNAQQNSKPSNKKTNEKEYIIAAALISLMIVIGIIIQANTKQTGEQIIDEYNKLRTLSDGDSIKPKESSIMEEQEVGTGSVAYHNWFGKGVFSSDKTPVFKVSNSSPQDIVFLLVNDSTNKVVRNYYLEKNYFCSMMNIPKGIYYLKVYSGTDFTYYNQRNYNKVSGGFDHFGNYHSIYDKKIAFTLQQKDTNRFEFNNEILYNKKWLITEEQFFER